MKTQSQTLFNKMGKTVTENQAAGVEETLVKESSNNHRKTFGAVDMWNIQRQRKTLVIR